MVVNRKVTGTASSMAGGLVWGGLVSLGLTVTLSVLTAKLVDTGALQEAAIGYAALIILLLSSAAGSLMAISRVKRQRLLVCLAAGAVYYLLLVSLTALFFGGQYNGMGTTALAVIGGSGTVSLMTSGQGKGRKHHFAATHR